MDDWWGRSGNDRGAWGPPCGEIYNDGDFAVQRWANLMQECIELYRIGNGGEWHLVSEFSSVPAAMNYIRKWREEGGPRKAVDGDIFGVEKP